MTTDSGSGGLNLDLLGVLSEAGGGMVGIADLLQSLAIPKEKLYRDLDALRAAGYVIGKSHPYGSTAYQLLEVPDLLTAHEVGRRLDTKWLGRTLFCLELCESTNDVARSLLPEDAPHGTVVTAERQTAGRGRGAGRWHSPEGMGIYVSVVLRPAGEAPSSAALQVATSVAVAHTAMKRTGKPAGLRWPNDVTMRGRKIAGVLTDATTGPDGTTSFVVGIGLNVGHSPTDFPADLRESATSLRIEAGEALSRLRILRTLLPTLEEWYDRLAAGDLAALENAWRPLSALLGQDVTLERGGKKLAGRVLDLSLDRGLKLATVSGEEWIPAEHARLVRPVGKKC